MEIVLFVNVMIVRDVIIMVNIDSAMFNAMCYSTGIIIASVLIILDLYKEHTKKNKK